MNILKYIPVGHENAISRRELASQMGLSDRDMRRELEKARTEIVIISRPTGEGYYIPNPSDSVDVGELRAWIRQENARANSILNGIKIANVYLMEVEDEVEM